MEDENELKCDNTCCYRDLVLLYEGEEFRSYLEHHVTNYQQLHGKNVKITLQGVNSPLSWSPLNNVLGDETPSQGDALIDRINSFPDTWDGAVFPGHMMGALQESNRLWDWNDYLQKQRKNQDGNKIDMEWMDIHPFFRSQAQQQVGKKKSLRPSSFFEWQSLTDGDTDTDTDADGVIRGRTLYAPLDGDVISLYYRKDLFEEYGIPIPRTWDEYRDVAIYFYGRPLGPDGSQLSGSCIARKSGISSENDMDSYWASLVLSTMTQTKGTSSGFLLDTETADPILGEAMDETLLFLAQEAGLSKVDSDSDSWNGLPSPAGALNEGSCAMTLSWIKPLMINTDPEQLSNIGVAPTPGSKRVLDRKSGRLETCTPELCPYGTYYDDIGIVNRPSYSAYGGWMGGVSNDSTSAKQQEMADFFSYISNPFESLNDVLPNERSNFVTPYRYSQTKASLWAGAGLDNDTAFDYTETVKEVNSDNTVSEIRIPPEAAIRGIINQEVKNYLVGSGGNKYESLMAVNSFVDNRSEFTANMDRRIRDIIKSTGTETVVKNYKASLSFHNGPEDVSMNYIDIPYRDTGWGVAILICSASMAVICWVLWNRKKAVMRAFQPILLIQSAVGFFIMGATLVPLGFDDSLFGKDILDITCMTIPWMYVVGYTVFFSSVYSKIQVCTKIYKHPRKYDRMMVRPINSFKLFLKLLVLNGVLLSIWTAVDPLKWSRTEKTIHGSYLPYGAVESYGSCKSEKFTYPYFAIGLFVFNLVSCFFAMLQALRCRMLVLEYRQMQWLQLCLVPFFEAWIIGGPVIAILYERPTPQYVAFVLVIATSSLASASAIFGPKEWVVRKHNVLSNELAPEHPPTPFVKILKHPKFESQKHVATLQNRLERYTTSNTELAIDIRVLQEKFRLLTEKEKLAAVRGSIYSRTVMESEHSRIKSMMSDDEEASKSEKGTADFKSALNDMRRNSYNQIVIPKNASSHPRVSELSIDMEELNQLRSEAGKLISHDDSDPSGGKSGKSLLFLESGSSFVSSFALDSRISEEGSEDFAATNDQLETTDDIKELAYHSVSQGSKTKAAVTEMSTTSSGNDTKVSVEIEDLDEMIESDNIQELKSDAMMMAEEFKMSSSLLENVSDLKRDDSERTREDLRQMVHSDKDNARDLASEAVLMAELFKKKNGLLESISDLEAGDQEMLEEELNDDGLSEMLEDALKDDGLSEIIEEDLKHDGFHTLDISNATATSTSSATLLTKNYSKVVAQFASTINLDGSEPPISSTGESSGSYTPPLETNGGENLHTDQNAGEPSSDYRAPLKSPTVSIEGWTPTSQMMALLNDMSDTTSSASASSRSMTDSVASLEIIASTPRYSGVQMGNDIKTLLNHHGFDAVETHPDTPNSGGDKSDSSSTKLSDVRQKKRELEARRLAIVRHQQKDPKDC